MRGNWRLLFPSLPSPPGHTVGASPSLMAHGAAAHTSSFSWLKTDSELLPLESLVTAKFHLLGNKCAGVKPPGIYAYSLIVNTCWQSPALAKQVCISFLFLFIFNLCLSWLCICCLITNFQTLWTGSIVGEWGLGRRKTHPQRSLP